MHRIIFFTEAIVICKIFLLIIISFILTFKVCQVFSSIFSYIDIFIVKGLFNSVRLYLKSAFLHTLSIHC